MAKQFRRVILHVGPPKTGTTSIQTFLKKNRAALRTRGVYVPSALMRGSQHFELAFLFEPTRKGLDRLAEPSERAIDERREIAAHDLAAELTRVNDAHTLLISSEHLFVARPYAIKDYRKLFKPHADQFESLMYLRRQDRWRVSSLLQSRKTGSRGELQLDAGRTHRFERSVRAWDGKSDVCHIRRFDSEFLVGGSLLDDFCETIGCDIAGLDIARPNNVAINQEDDELIDALNGRLTVSHPRQMIPYRAGLLTVCGEVVRGTRFEFSRAQAEAAFNAYAPINTWLRETRDPNGPALFFNADFSDYPVEPNNNRVYTRQQLDAISSALEARLSEGCLGIPARPRGETRESIVAHIVSCVIALQRGKVAARRVTRKRRHAARVARRSSAAA